MAQKTTAAWVTYFDDIRCLEASTASKVAWLKSLYLGCLNKSVGDKLKVYSHLRSLSSKVDIPFPSEETCSRRFTLHIDNSEVEIEDQAREQKEVEESKHRALSLVILEDNSRPPEATEEVSPLLFTPTAFFNYLYSGNWGGHISIRVINGELLHLLLAALCSLEMQFLVDSNIIYANLNNRLRVGLQKDLQKQNVIAKATKRVQEHFPNTHIPNREFVYEKMNVEIVFYEKAEVSNIPYVTREFGNSDYVTQMPHQRDITRYPYDLNYHEIDYVRLPTREDVDIKSTLLRLKAELSELKAAELPPKDISAPGRFPEKENAVPERVEWIADDPYLVPEHRGELNISGTVRSTGDEESPSALKSPFVRKNSQAISDPQSSSILTEEEVILNEILSHLSKHYSSHDFDEEEEHVGVQSVQSSEGSYVIISSPSQFMKKEKEEPTCKKLHLTRRELYITGLYSPRKENSVCLEDKLQRTRRKRFAHRLAKEKSIYEKLQENLPFNITDRFKCLDSAKLDAKKKALGLQISKQAKMAKLSLPGPLSLWENYSKDQENMEMETALINDVEREVINRLSENKKQKIETEPDVKSKGTRNKSKNNPDEIDSSPIRSKRGKAMSTNQQISKNLNTSAKTKTGNHFEASTKYKLPHIDIEKKEEALVSEHKLSVTLPRLFQRENQDKQRRSRRNKQNRTGNKEIIPGPLTEELWNQTTDRNIKNKKHSNRHLSKLEKIHEGASGRKDIVHTWNKESTMLPSRQSQDDLNHNRNQNNLTENDQEDQEQVDETDEEEEDEEEINAAPQKAVSAQEMLVDKDENEIKYVDSYNEKLEQFRCQCSCEECICLTEALSRETGDTCDTTYPMILGRMRRDFKFLKYANYEPKSVSTCADSYFNLPKLTHQTVCDHLLKLMENVLVRKEILTSSLGYKYITITFTKPDTSNT